MFRRRAVLEFATDSDGGVFPIFVFRRFMQNTGVRHWGEVPPQRPPFRPKDKALKERLANTSPKLRKESSEDFVHFWGASLRVKVTSWMCGRKFSWDDLPNPSRRCEENIFSFSREIWPKPPFFAKTPCIPPKTRKSRKK